MSNRRSSRLSDHVTSEPGACGRVVINRRSTSLSCNPARYLAFRPRTRRKQFGQALCIFIRYIFCSSVPWVHVCASTTYVYRSPFQCWGEKIVNESSRFRTLRRAKTEYLRWAMGMTWYAKVGDKITWDDGGTGLRARHCLSIEKIRFDSCRKHGSCIRRRVFFVTMRVKTI